MNARDIISTHVDCDRPTLYRFERSSGLPRGYFDERRITSSACLWAATAMLAVALLAAVLL